MAYELYDDNISRMQGVTKYWVNLVPLSQIFEWRKMVKSTANLGKRSIEQW
jgi:hypothetical protein